MLFTEEKWQKQKRKRLIRVLVLVFNLKNEDFGSILTMSKCFISQNEVGCSGFMFCNDYDDIYEFTKKKNDNTLEIDIVMNFQVGFSPNLCSPINCMSFTILVLNPNYNFFLGGLRLETRLVTLMRQSS